jgi:type IV pilus assembly protein PilQ
MGEEVSYKGLGTWRLAALAATVLGAAIVTAATGTVLAEGRSADAGRVPSRGNASAAETAVGGPAETLAPREILAVGVREGAPGYYVDVRADGPLQWTSFRDEEDRVVVQLSNSQPAPGLTSHLAGEGPVESIEVAADRRALRPTTLLTIATRQPVEHSLEAQGNRLEVRLLPVSNEPVSGFTYEPLPVEAPAAEVRIAQAQLPSASPPGNLLPPSPVAVPRAETQIAAAAAQGTPQGTADNPVVAPAPAGAPATRLTAVSVVSREPGTVIRVSGDGEFQYSYFSLDNPARFVVDLAGVINESNSSALPVGSELVERVRVAQFKPYPDPVARVVFDLARGAVPQVESGADGLSFHFQQPGATPPEASAGELLSEVSPAPAEPSATPEPPMEKPPMVGDVARVSEVQAPVTAPVPSFPQRSGLPPIQRETPSPPGPEAGFSVATLGGAETQWVGEPIDMKVRDADVVEVLRMFAQISGLNVVIQPGVSGTVTVELENVPWDQALDQILKINGLGFELEGNIMRIAPTSVLAQEAEERQRLEQAKALSVPLRTIFRRLSYANASQLAALLASSGGILSQRGSVIVDQRTNSMIIKELPEFMDTVIAVIENLDTPEPQVMIEARIVETTKRFTRTLGVQWNFRGEATPERGTTTGLEFPNRIDARGGVNLLTGAQSGFLGLTLGNILDSFSIDAMLQAAETEGLINILSAPKVATLNNETASIQSGLQIPIQTIANNTVTVQFVNATLELEVTPQVTAEGTILMDIEIAKREPQLAFAVQGAANAPISTKEARTRVIVRDGGTTVIGGIYEVSTDQGEDRVPGLSNVPILGHLFRNKRRTDENDELLIFITPRVINL